MGEIGVMYIVAGGSLLALIYALFLYRSNRSFMRITLSKLCVNILINVLLGSVWRVAMSGNFYAYYVAISAVKNVALFPAEVVILCLVMTALARPLASFGYGGGNGTFARLTAKRIVFLAVLTAAGVALITLFILYYSQIKDWLSFLKT